MSQQTVKILCAELVVSMSTDELVCVGVLGGIERGTSRQKCRDGYADRKTEEQISKQASRQTRKIDRQTGSKQKHTNSYAGRQVGMQTVRLPHSLTNFYLPHPSPSYSIVLSSSTTQTLSPSSGLASLARP